MKVCIAEKPSVAREIAEVLGATKKMNGYIEGNGYQVTWTFGHLCTLKEPNDYSENWKRWSLASLPMIPPRFGIKLISNPTYEQQFKTIEELMQNAEMVINCGDAGQEGELIQRWVMQKAGCKCPVYRLWISSLTEEAIREGFQHLKEQSDFTKLYEAGLSRAIGDWLLGMNATRLYTLRYGQNRQVLSIGRVQTPTLAMLVERESKIMNFKKEQYFMAHILCGGVDAVTERIDNKTEAENVAGACLNGQALVTSVAKEEKTVAPPKLYDLTTLQRDANRLFGFTAKQTLEYTQSLYEKKLCTYPRTDSQYLSDDMEQTTGNVIEAIFSSILFEENMMFNPDIPRVLNSKKVTDHHAIIPTMEIAKADLAALPETERKILSLVANRLLCATGEKHLYETVKAELSCGGYTFATSGKSILKNGWKDFEDAFKRSFKTTEDKEQEDKKLPELSEGQTFDGVQTKISEHYTTPLKHFTEDSLLSAMERAGNEDMSDDVERKGLGTPATRADIIEKLVKDGFVKREKKQMIPTEDGMKLITVLPDVVKSPKLTADWENALTLVAKGEMEREDFMGDIETMVSGLIHTYHEVSDEQKKMFAQEQKVLGKCPNCGGEVVKGKYGAFCKNKCGMNVSRIMGVSLSDEQVESLLAGKKTLLKGLTSKAGKKYDAYIIPSGTEEYHYTKDGEEKSGVQFKFVMEFPKRKFTGKKK